MTLIELQEDIKLGQFIAVKKAIEECLMGLVIENKESYEVKVIYNINSDELQVALESGKKLAFNLLSDGYSFSNGSVKSIFRRKCY